MLRSLLAPRALLPLLAAMPLLAVPAAGAREHGRPPHGAVGACSASHAPVRAATIVRSRDAMLCLLNRVRAQHGLPPLRLNVRLSHAAGQHSREMVRRRYFGHDSANGRSPFDRMRATHYVPRDASWSLGENIGWGSGAFAEPIAMVRAWMHSPPHRANILSRTFRDVGIGIAPGAPVGGRGATYTTDFGRHS